MENLIKLVEQWHVDRNLIDGAIKIITRNG